jgi:cytochrome c-type biogenesis protein CcmH
MSTPKTSSARRRWNRAAKTWPGWAMLVFALIGLLAVGGTRDPGPRSVGGRVDDISRRIACPTCDGESVYESRANASESIRSEITAQVNQGGRSDDEIIEFIAARFGGEVLLVPRSSGIEALAWAIPAAALVCALAGLTVAFRRWQVAARSGREATDEDYLLVDNALADLAQADATRRSRAEPGGSAPPGDRERGSP